MGDKVPPADSGREYATLEERCAACVVNGGEEGMCISDSHSARLQESTGRPCPRVELDTDNIEAFRLIGWTADDDLKPLAPMFAAALLHGREPEEKLRILSRLGSALKSREIRSAMHPSSEG